MSEIFNETTAVRANFNRWSIPVRMGVLIGVISTIVSTADIALVMPHNYMTSLVIFVLIFVLIAILLGVTGAQQRKAMGGFISFKDAYIAIIVAALISLAIGTVFGIIYNRYIDPDAGEKMKSGMLEFMEKMKQPQESIDKSIAKMDKQIIDGKRPAGILYSFLKSSLIFAVISLICAAVVQRKPKVEMR